MALKTYTYLYLTYTRDTNNYLRDVPLEFICNLKSLCMKIINHIYYLLVWMPFSSKFFVSRFDCFLGGSLLQAKYLCNELGFTIRYNKIQDYCWFIATHSAHMAPQCLGLLNPAISTASSKIFTHYLIYFHLTFILKNFPEARGTT